MDNLLKYILFCIIAIVINLSTQRIIMELIFINNYFLALLIGTLFGLVIKFILDKNIFLLTLIPLLKIILLNFLFIHLTEFLLHYYFGEQRVFFSSYTKPILLENLEL